MISVIMTVYNDEKFLEETIKSVLIQSFENFEFIIVDDKSTDRSLEIVEKISYIDKRIKVFSGKKYGRAKALAYALAKCNYDLVCNIDSDDPFLPEKLEKQYTYMKLNPEIVLLGTSSLTIDKYGNKTGKILPPLKSEEIKRSLGKICPFNHSSVMFRKREIEKIGGYNENLKKQIDIDLWIRILKEYKTENLEEVLTTKRLHENQFFEQGIIKKEFLSSIFSGQSIRLKAIKELELSKLYILRHYILSILKVLSYLLPIKYQILMKRKWKSLINLRQIQKGS